jgi:putative FmdB family regulatory protein
MPLYDYDCIKCDFTTEKYHKIAEEPLFYCPDCLYTLRKAMTTGAVRRPDASWVKDINGTINDLADAQSGKQEYITTREQARAAINKTYSDPHPNVQKLRQRYLERY